MKFFRELNTTDCFPRPLPLKGGQTAGQTSVPAHDISMSKSSPTNCLTCCHVAISTTLRSWSSTAATNDFYLNCNKLRQALLAAIMCTYSAPRAPLTAVRCARTKTSPHGRGSQSSHLRAVSGTEIISGSRPPSRQSRHHTESDEIVLDGY